MGLLPYFWLYKTRILYSIKKYQLFWYQMKGETLGFKKVKVIYPSKSPFESYRISNRMIDLHKNV